MSDEELDELIAPQPPRRGWRRFWFRAGCVFGLLLLVVLIARWKIGLKSEQSLQEMLQHIEATEQKWGMEAIEDERIARQPPDHENAAKLVLEIDGELPEAWNAWRRNSPTWVPIHDNHLPSSERIDELRLNQAGTVEIRNRAIKLREICKGCYFYHPADLPLATCLPHLDSASRVVSLLEYDACLALLEGNPDRGIQAAHAALNVSRSIGDEPTLVSQNFRTMFRSRAAITILGTLAGGVPTRGLKELQDDLLADAEERLFLYGVRGERAAYHRMFAGLESGRLKCDQILTVRGPVGTPLALPAVFETYKPLLRGDHAECLRLYSRCIEIAMFPWHEQRQAIGTISAARDGLSETRFPLTRLLFPPLDRLVETGVRSRAELLMTGAAIACERFRQEHQRWPGKLEEIPKSVLPSVPQNPFNQEPLRYQVLPDRIVISCFSRPNGPETGEPADIREAKAGPIEFRLPHSPGFGIAVTVWNVDQRALPFRLR